LIDYVNDCPIPPALQPPRLRALLEPAGAGADLRIDVTSRFDEDHYGLNRECAHMIMAVVRDVDALALKDFRETGAGVVNQSRPDVSERGGLAEFNVSISGHDYIVASNGDGSFYGYQLADKVWIGLGLTPRAEGGKGQKLTYDDLSAPVFGVAEGEISTKYHYSPDRNARWNMSNDYLRRYLWMRGAHGVRLFYYEKRFEDLPELRTLMKGEPHVDIKPENGWCEIGIREFKGGLLVQMWAVVAAVSPELCETPDVETLEWPGAPGPMTYARASAYIHGAPVFLDDRFLERYEQNSLFDTMPTRAGAVWLCGPSYQGQWSFTDCERAGRNLIRASVRKLYAGLPDREIAYAHSFVLSAEKAAEFDQAEEHIVSKTARFADVLLALGDHLEILGGAVGAPKPAADIVDLSRADLKANQWRNYPELSRLAQTAPLAITEQAFLSRCKSLHEFWQRIPNGYLKALLERSGHPRDAVKQLKSAKLLQGLTNMLERLNADGERLDAFAGAADAADLQRRNVGMGALFTVNDLRLADAHHAGETLAHLESLDFDISRVNEGYGRAVDHVFDSVIDAFSHINAQLDSLIRR
jgi:hypothetical protein